MPYILHGRVLSCLSVCCLSVCQSICLAYSEVGIVFWERIRIHPVYLSICPVYLSCLSVCLSAYACLPAIREFWQRVDCWIRIALHRTPRYRTAPLFFNVSKKGEEQ